MASDTKKKASKKKVAKKSQEKRKKTTKKTVKKGIDSNKVVAKNSVKAHNRPQPISDGVSRAAEFLHKRMKKIEEEAKKIAADDGIEIEVKVFIIPKNRSIKK